MKFVPWFLTFWVAILILAGVTVDAGGRVMTAQEAISIAQSAARSGTNAASGQAMNGDAFDLNESMAVTAAQSYLQQAGIDGTVRVEGRTVIVTVTTTYKTRLISMIGITELPVTATASAELISG